MLQSILRCGINEIFLWIQSCLNTTCAGQIWAWVVFTCSQNKIEMQLKKKTNLKKKKKKAYEQKITLITNPLPIVCKKKSLL